MSDSKDLKIDGEGNFYKWKKLLEVEDRVKSTTSTGLGYVPGSDIGALLGTHIGEVVKITVEIKQES